jgi:hypothetical protein
VFSKYLDISSLQNSPVATVKFFAGAENYKLFIVKKCGNYYTRNGQRKIAVPHRHGRPDDFYNS